MSSVERQTDLLTEAQRRAVAARGNVLVVAGAGTGKTKTLVERCLNCMEQGGASVDELLIVTFTEAAAGEMRDRLRKAIEARSQAGSQEEQPAVADFWSEQLARFDLAYIGTLHSFCLKLVREHFYDLGLDPHLAILEEGEARQLANEILDDQFDKHYAGRHEFSNAVQNLIQIHGGGRDEPIRKLVLQLHNYSQARPDAVGWLAEQRNKFSSAEPANWRRWLPESIVNWSNEWFSAWKTQKAENPKIAELTPMLSDLSGLSSSAGWRGTSAEILTRILSTDGNWPKGRKTALRKPLEGFFREANFFHSLLIVNDGKDPLAEDWSWIRDQMETLLRLAEEFASMLAERKHMDGALDFHDLEQFALKLLWDFSAGKPTAVAESWRVKLKFVFVDEYQDINAAQDKIIQGLSREGAAANRFLVGDVKQSIYRFRLADPTIFRGYIQNWRGNLGETISLRDNFRSREGVLDLVNSIFRHVMCEEIGGVAYDAGSELKFGASGPSADSTAKRDPMPVAELLLRFKSGCSENREEDESAIAALDDAQREARMVAMRLKQFVAGRHEVFDSAQKTFRAVDWHDIAILLRSPRGRAEIFAKEFELAGIPLAVARGGFYESAEILDLLSLLQLLDNPLQDVPCIAVLRSPFVGLSLNDLAEIRLAARDKHFWTALNRSRETGTGSAEAQGKTSLFLERFSRWRRLAKLVSLSQCLDEILAETLYADWLRAQPRGAERAAKVTGFLELTQRFDQFQRQGLFRFLKFVEAQQEAGAEPEVPATTAENAVRLMSIHQSKGLEFPVVVLADLGKQFNERDLRGEIIFDEEFGLCPKVKPPHIGRRYPSLTNWLAQRRQKRELRGEELRLLYVALTRARDHLILTASVTEKSWEEKWRQPQGITVQKIAAAKCFADWLALWFSNHVSAEKSKAENVLEGEFEFLLWRVIPDEELKADATVLEALPSHERPDSIKSEGQTVSGTADQEQLGQLKERLEWNYPFTAAARRKAKSSVTALRREAEELNDEAEKLFSNADYEPVGHHRHAGSSKLSASEVGVAHHKFLQHFDLARAKDVAAEAKRLVSEGYLNVEEQKALDLDALAGFWDSSLGRKIRKHGDDVRRELPFTARFSPQEIEAITGKKAEAGLEDEFVIVQGVADLVVLRPDEIWLVDFKTDEVSAKEMEEKTKIYKPQLELYASALEKVFGRKVTLRTLHFFSARRADEI